jgi:DNA polymerase-3 subunit delta'
MVDLAEIVGQPQAVSQLQLAITSGRVPHAMLFAGPRGVGRRTTAKAFARTLLCRNRPPGPARACGTCDDCRMTAADAHPDVHEVYKELAAYHDDSQVRQRVMQELSIAVVRSFLIAPASRAPARGVAKVFIVRQAELMSDDAQDALLKTLEEPAPGVSIILLAQTPDQLLPTTRSRCRLVRFVPLPRPFVVQRLLEQQVPQPEAQFWAAFTDGSLGAALAAAKSGLYEIKRRIVDGLAAAGGPEPSLGEKLTKQADELAESYVKSAKADASVDMSKTLATRQAASTLLQIIAGLHRDALNLSVGRDDAIAHADQNTAVRAVAARHSPRVLAEIIEQLSTCEQLLWRNANPKIVWDNVVITCASAAPLRF